LLLVQAARVEEAWLKQATKLENDPDAYQVMLQTSPSSTTYIDAHLLLKSRKAWLNHNPADGCGAVLLLLERSIMKEQLAAGVLAQPPDEAGRGSSSGGGLGSFLRKVIPGLKKHHDLEADAAGAAGASSCWSRVQPLPPDVYVSLIEAVTAAALLGMGAGNISVHAYIPESARNSLMDPVLVPPGSLTEVARAWNAPQSSRSTRSAVQGARAQAEAVLARCLGVCSELASVNWRLLKQQQQQQQQAAAGAPAGGVAGVGSGGMQPSADEAAAADLSKSVQPDCQAPASTASHCDEAAAPTTGTAMPQHAALPLVFTEHLAALSATDFKGLTERQQQQDPHLGVETASLLPVLAARCSLLLGCVIFSMAAGEAAAAASGGRAPHLTQPLLLPAVAAAQQMTTVAADLALSLPQQDQQQMQWLLQVLQPLQKLLPLLLPVSSLPAPPDHDHDDAGSSSSSVSGSSKKSAATGQISLQKLLESLFPLAQALGMQIVQVG
jgi:hypothetical protein